VDKIEERKIELRNTTERIDKIINGLENNEAFILMLDDFKRNAKNIDDNWQFIDDDQKLRSMKIIKLATMSVINILDTYKNDLRNATIELAKLENPDVLVNKDYDAN